MTVLEDALKSIDPMDYPRLLLVLQQYMKDTAAGWLAAHPDLFHKRVLELWGDLPEVLHRALLPYLDAN